LIIQWSGICWFVQEFDAAAFSIMSAAGIYLVCRLPATVFREQYLTTMRELVGAQRLADGREEMYERFARALASAVSAVLWCLCLSFLSRPLLKPVSTAS